MRRWYIRDLHGVEEYEGHVISGAAYSFAPVGRRAKVARLMRDDISNRASQLRADRIGKQATRQPLSDAP